MSKTTSTVAVKSVNVLTADMIAENDASRQTMWIALGAVALRFRKLYVPGTPRGSIFGLVRTVEGRAFLIALTATTPTLDDKFSACDAPVTVNARRFDAYVAVEASENDGALCALLIDESKRCYRVVRATAYDNLGYSADLT